MPAVLTSRSGAVLTITLNRPDVFNAFDTEMHQGLYDALRDAEDPDVRAVVITGAGRGFCAGQVVRHIDPSGGEPAIGELLRTTFHPKVRLIRALEKPVIAAVNGACAGAGLSLACACDARVASDSASFVPGFIGIGLIPDAGGTWLLSRILGGPRAFEWMSSNRRLSAMEALSWGLVSDVFPADAFAERTSEVAAIWATLPTRAVAMMKRLFEGAQTNTLEEQLELEAVSQDVAARTRDFEEGVRAFTDKRQPRFGGA